MASEILTAETPGILQLLCTEVLLFINFITAFNLLRLQETFNKILTVLDYPAPINPLIARCVPLSTNKYMQEIEYLYFTVISLNYLHSCW